MAPEVACLPHRKCRLLPSCHWFLSSMTPAGYGCRGGTFPAALRLRAPAQAMEGEGGSWICPGRRRRRRRRRAEEEEEEEEEEARERQTQRLKDARSELRSSEFWEASLGVITHALGSRLPGKGEGADGGVLGTLLALRHLQVVTPARGAPEPDGLPREEGPLQCVCYGLGSFSSCVKARYQLAFLLLLLEELQIPHRSCHVFDPVFSELDIDILNHLGFSLVLENEEGKRGVSSPTLFYMVHCGKALYNNLLWRNWSAEALSQTVVIGNSFRGMEERVPSKVLQKDYGYIAKVLEATREAPLPSHPQYLDIFSDTSVHCFPLARLRGLRPETWAFRQEPFYPEDSDQQLEIIRCQR